MRSKGSTYTHTYSLFKLFKVLYKVLNFKAATHGGPDGRVVQGNRLTTFVVEPVVHTVVLTFQVKGGKQTKSALLNNNYYSRSLS